MIHVAMLKAAMDIVDVLGDVFKTQAAEGGAPETELLKVDDLTSRLNRRFLAKIQLLQTAEPKDGDQ